MRKDLCGTASGNSQLASRPRVDGVKSTIASPRRIARAWAARTMGIGKTDGDGRRSAEHRLRREGLYPRVLSISIPHPALHKYIPHVFGGLMGGALEQEYKTTRLQISRVHGLPVARRLALLGPLRARLRDARAVGLAAALSIIIITIGHLEPELEELLEAAHSFRLCS